MNRNLLKTCVGVAAMMLISGQALAQNDKPKSPAPPSAPKPVQPSTPGKPGEAKPGNAQPGAADPSMEAMMKAGMPGEFHKHLAVMAGEWAAACKFRMTPEMPWEDSKGTCKSKMEWGGRFLESEYSGDMAGMAFTGRGAWGYDNAAKQYESTWRDSMSTATMFMTGTCDGTGKVFTLKGDCIDPMTGQKKSFKQVTTIKDPATYMMEFFDFGPDGKEFKNMEITYTRTGSAGSAGSGKPAGDGIKK